MVNKFQYGDTIYVTTIIAATRDADGNWIAATETESDGYECRAEPNGGGFISKADGTMVNYEWIVYGKDIPKLVPGQKVRVIGRDGSEIFKDRVKQYSIGVFNKRVWL